MPIDLKTHFPPKNSHPAQKWEFRYSIAGRYIGGDDPLEQIAGGFDLTRERIRQIVKKGIKEIWGNSPPEIKDRFPFASFNFRKPLSLKSRQRKSQAHGGQSLVVYNLTQGKSPAEIRKALGGTYHGRYKRKVLRSWGIDIPRQNNDYSQLAQAQISAADAQKVLDSIRNISVPDMLRRTNPLIVSLLPVARKADLYPRSQDLPDILGVLQSQGVPSRAVAVTTHKNGQEVKITYRILPAVFEKRAIGYLANALELEHLRENPVTVLGKPTDQIPNTYELCRSGNYRHLGPLIKDIRGEAIASRSKVTIPQILEGCPVPVYRVPPRYGNLYQISQEPGLRQFLELRLKQLGLL